jgi:hypothetical protein
MVKALGACSWNYLIVPCQIQQASHALVCTLSNALKRRPALPADQLGFVG